jgi:DNA-directed RNA polymerase specialized sigma24 family protein
VRQKSAAGAAEAGEVVAAGKGPTTLAVGEGDFERVRRAVEELPEGEREVVRLKYLKEKSYEEIAQERGMKVAQVRIVIEKARRELKRKLALYFTGRIGERGELAELFESIESLPELYKKAFVLRHVEGLTEKEVAERLSKAGGAGVGAAGEGAVGEKAVKARLARAYDHLRVEAGQSMWEKFRVLLGV